MLTDGEFYVIIYKLKNKVRLPHGKESEVGQITAVASIKGGVGKTVVSAGLAFAFASLGARALGVDLDLGAGGLDLALGREDMLLPTLADVIRGDFSENDLFPGADGVAFLSAPVAFGADPFAGVKQEDFDRALLFLKDRFDQIVLDLPAGGGSAFPYLERSGLADRILLVTTSSPASVRAAERCAMQLSEPEKVRLVLNAYRLSRPDDNAYPVTEIIRRAGVRIIGAVPMDPGAEKALMAGTPLTAVPKSPAGKAISNIALRLTGEEVPLLDGVLRRGKRVRFY